jgi:hypothetical protein
VRVFENRGLRRIFGPKNDIKREWRRLHSEELYALNPSTNVIRVIKSRRLRWAGCVVRKGEKRGAYRVLVGKREERDHLEDPDVHWKMILKWILKKKEREACTRLIWLRLGTDGWWL